MVVIPVQPESATCSLRYSSAFRPIAEIAEEEDGDVELDAEFDVDDDQVGAADDEGLVAAFHVRAIEYLRSVLDDLGDAFGGEVEVLPS